MPVVPTLDVEKYLDFKSMTQYLKAVSSAAPHLVRAFSIGKSKGGKPLLVAEVTNRNLREGRQKPGVWIDGGHQGWNLLGSTACLELIRFLVAGHGRDEFLTDLVDQTVFYIAPRLAPDEMEVCLKTGALIPQQAVAGGPVSQQGRQFRIQNELGSWKPFKRDNRVLVPRNPEDRKGPFYDLYRQIDSNRIHRAGPNDFPAQNNPLELPLQASSSRAIFEFMRTHTNVFGVISTSGPGDRIQLLGGAAETTFTNNLGQRLSELAGLPYAGAPPVERTTGQFLRWAGESLGLLAADCQMWSLRTAAGLKADDLEDPLKAEETEYLQLLRFCEKEFPENSFGEWKEVEDPVLGKGEIGGWDWSQTWLNPPSGPYLGRELKKLSRLALGMAAASPRLSISRIEEQVVGWSEQKKPLRKVTVRVENSGFLPTCPVNSGRELNGKLELELGKNTLHIGNQQTVLKELRGNGSPVARDGLPHFEDSVNFPTARTMTETFLVEGPDPIGVRVSHELAGSEEKTSRPPQNLRAPSFDSSIAEQPAAEAEPTEEDPFEDVFPSFEELHHTQPSLPEASVAPPPPPPPEPPPPPPPTIPDSAQSGEFNIPDPSPQQPARAVQFASLDEPEPAPKKESKGSPFPSNKPAKGRVFGSPPQKPTGGLPAALGGGKEATASQKPEKEKGSEGEFSPLPLIGAGDSGGAFEPMSPKEATAQKESSPSAETLGFDTLTDPGPGSSAPPPPQQGQQAASPPARLSRTAPQLLRRQRGGKNNPREPFKRS